jgi:hypothetical protein
MVQLPAAGACPPAPHGTAPQARTRGSGDAVGDCVTGVAVGDGDAVQPLMHLKEPTQLFGFDDIQ